MTVKVRKYQMSGTDGKAHSKKEMNAIGLFKFFFV
jgi:hypothetical protein